MKSRWVLAFCLMMFFAPLRAADNPAAIPPAEKVLPPEPETIASTEIPARANALQTQLSELSKEMELDDRTVKMLQDLPEETKALESESKAFDRLHLYQMDTRRLEDLEQRWLGLEKDFSGYLADISDATKHYETIDQKLETATTLWRATKRIALKEKAPAAILKRIDAVLKALDDANRELKKRYDVLLVKSDVVSKEILQIQKRYKQIEDVRTVRQKSLYVRDSPGLFTALSHEPLDFGAYVSSCLSELATDTKQSVSYVTQSAAYWMVPSFVTLVMLLSLLYMLKLDRDDRLFVKRDKVTEGAAVFLRAPFTSAVLLGLVSMAFLYSDRPPSVDVSLMLAGTIPVLRIMHKVSSATLRPYVYGVVALSALASIQQPLPATLISDRLLNLLFALALFMMTYRFLRPDGPAHEISTARWARFFVRLTPLLGLVMLAAVAANLYGSARLSRFLVAISLASLFSLISWYIAARVLIGIATLFIRRRSAQSLYIVKSYADEMQANVRFLIMLVVTLYWLDGVIKRMGIDGLLSQWYDALKAYSFEIGTVTLSVKNFLDFIIIIAATYFISKILRMILELEVFSRIKVPRGIPMAVSVLLHYTIVIFGAVLALLALGMKMNDLSLLAGTMGLGLGFGLRNIMANFVSGIILIFERPVQNGDTVEIGAIQGDVKQIGVRSTTIHAYNGAEMIVPNADFMTQTVTNHTLSNDKRRFEVVIRVDTGADPHAVMALMKAQAECQPDILGDPAPSVYFLGFGDYYLEFRLYFWLRENILQARSELALGIYDALRAEGIAFPVPRQKVELGTPNASEDD